jgi:polysaccharide deacetylase family protein (PEP-CTERM system associated)
MINVLSIDVEEWYHICGVEHYLPLKKRESYDSRLNENMDYLLDLLSNYQLKATFFVLGCIAEKYPQLIKKINQEGHEIATHGYAHKRIYEMSKATFREDTRRSVGILESIIGKRILGFRAPEWSVWPETLWALDILAELEIKYDSSICPFICLGGRSLGRFPFLYKTKNGLIWEFPISTMSFLGEPIPVTGGFPLRLSPFSLIAWVIACWNRKGFPTIIYLHPWELDTDPPRVYLPLMKKIIHYFNINSTRAKLVRLFQRFSFAPFKEVYKERLGNLT